MDLTVVWAGPYATMQLADWGAEVIRIESTRHFPATGTRGPVAHPSKAMVLASLGSGYPDNEAGNRPWNRNAVFNAHARNKLSMTVDLTRPEGQEVLDKLVQISDGLIENNAPASMDGLGITWERLSKINPRLIMLRMPAFGLDGPYRDHRMWGNHVEALLGHFLLRAYPNEDLNRSPIGIPSDPASGLGAAIGFLAALRYRRRTGAGTLVEVALAENFLNFLGDFLMDYNMNGRVAAQLGNDHPYFAPHNVYPCAGDDRWITIACRNDEEWRALRAVLGDPDKLSDPRFHDAVSRWHGRQTLDVLLAEETHTWDARQLMTRLQSVRVPAGVVLNEKDALEDPHLRARGFFERLTHPEAGTFDYVGPLFRMKETPNPLRRYAPRLGEDNEYVYKTLLGFSPEQYHHFEEIGHIGMDYDPSIP
ncbi:MAG: CoA transferase [Chloroflexi bacterium]|nr:CoA transferase [Chloroflexota bacterium]